MATRIGIDPGITGAIAVLRDGKVLLLADMPTVAKPSGRGSQVDAASLAALLRCCMDEDDRIEVLVENVSARPRQGVTSSFTFGVGFGIVLGVLAAHGLPYTLVSSAAWKRRAGIAGKPKDASRTRALQLQPDLSARLRHKRHHGRADAVLISRFGRSDG